MPTYPTFAEKFSVGTFLQTWQTCSKKCAVGIFWRCLHVPKKLSGGNVFVHFFKYVSCSNFVDNLYMCPKNLVGTFL